MEIWKDIQGYEGIYQVSNLGRIKSLERIVTNNKHGGVRIVEEKILTPTDNGNGYKIIGLQKPKQRKNFYIHRLVATAFIPNPKNFGYVNHKDYNKSNNNVSNLEWCTQKENVNYSVERMRKPRRVTKSSTGYKYVYLRKGKYRVCVHHKNEKCFDTLEKALSYRNEFLKEVI